MTIITWSALLDFEFKNNYFETFMLIKFDTIIFSSYRMMFFPPMNSLKKKKNVYIYL